MSEETLDQEIEDLKEKKRAEKAIREALDLPEGMRLSVCQHGHGAKRYYSAGISRCPDMDLQEAVSLVEKMSPQVQNTPSYKRKGWAASWAPESCNSSKEDEGEHEGNYQVCLEQHGGDRFRTIEISFWLDLGFPVDVGIHVNRLPRGWQAGVRIKSYDSQTGRPANCEYTKPQEIPFREIGTGGPGTYLYRSYWENIQTFRNDLVRAGITTGY